MIFRGSCPRNTSETTRRDVIVCKTLCPINNNSLFFSDATLDIAMPIPCKASSHAISGKAFRRRVWENKTPSHHVTRTALAARNNEAYGQRNGRQSFCTVLRYWTLEFSCVCGEDATRHRLVSDGWSISSYSVKKANNKIPVSSVFNDSEGLYGTTVCRCLVRRPHYSARLMRFGSRGPSEFATEMPWPRLLG